MSLADGLIVVALLISAFSARGEPLAILGPTHGVLFFALLATLAHGAAARWWRWRFVLAVALLGPLASIPGLERIRWTRQRAG